MDTSRRLLAKAVTWQLLGIVVMTLIGLAFTGSVTAGGGIALAGAASGVVLYMLHELLWSRIPWGRATAQAPAASPSSIGS